MALEVIVSYTQCRACQSYMGSCLCVPRLSNTEGHSVGWEKIPKRRVKTLGVSLPLFRGERAKRAGKRSS